MSLLPNRIIYDAISLGSTSIQQQDHNISVTNQNLKNTNLYSHSFEEINSEEQKAFNSCNMSRIIGTYKQLMYLSAYSTELFDNLLQLSKDVNSRLHKVSIRSQRLKKSIDEKRKQNSLITYQSHSDSTKISHEKDNDFIPVIFTRDLMSKELKSQYELCSKLPNFWKLTSILDGDPTVTYSDPGFFLRAWLTIEKRKLQEAKNLRKKMKEFRRKQNVVLKNLEKRQQEEVSKQRQVDNLESDDKIRLGTSGTDVNTDSHHPSDADQTILEIEKYAKYRENRSRHDRNDSVRRQSQVEQSLKGIFQSIKSDPEVSISLENYRKNSLVGQSTSEAKFKTQRSSIINQRKLSTSKLQSDDNKDDMARNRRTSQVDVINQSTDLAPPPTISKNSKQIETKNKKADSANKIFDFNSLLPKNVPSLDELLRSKDIARAAEMSDTSSKYRENINTLKEQPKISQSRRNRDFTQNERQTDQYHTLEDFLPPPPIDDKVAADKKNNLTLRPSLKNEISSGIKLKRAPSLKRRVDPRRKVLSDIQKASKESLKRVELSPRQLPAATNVITERRKLLQASDSESEMSEFSDEDYD